MFETKRKQLSILSIKELYTKGERDFSNIICTNTDFTKMKLSGCNFAGSDLSFNQFSEADISGCDFTQSNLEWSGFRKSNLKNSNFTKANLSYSVLNGAKTEGAKFEKTNLSWCTMFNVILTDEQKKTADFTMTAFHPNEVTDEGRQAVAEKIKAMKGTELGLRLEFIFKSDEEGIQKEKRINVGISQNVYGNTGKVSYGAKSDNYTVNQSQQGQLNYSSDSIYSSKKKKDIYK